MQIIYICIFFNRLKFRRLNAHKKAPQKAESKNKESKNADTHGLCSLWVVSFFSNSALFFPVPYASA